MWFKLSTIVSLYDLIGVAEAELSRRVVDLLGLIHVKNKSQSDSDIQLIQTLVEEYISNERMIILAVI